MLTRRFALIMGVLFLIVGILGFIPGITQMHGDDPRLSVEGPGHGYLLGIFHVNVLHNIVHILFGAWGIFAAATFYAARGYARVVAVSYAVLAILGMIPVANAWNTFGLIPIHGNDVWLHAIIAATASYFGFAVFADETHRGFAHDTTTMPR